MKKMRNQYNSKENKIGRKNIKKISKFPNKKTQQKPTPPTQTPKNQPLNQNKKNT